DFAVMGASQGNAIVPSLIVTIVVETMVAGLLLLIRRKPMYVLLWVPIVNLITLPALWWFVTGPFLFEDSSGGLKLLIAEIVVVLVEGSLLYLASRRAITLRYALTLSVIMNVASFVVGILLIFVGL